MAYRDYCSELVGTIPRLPYPLAQKLVNRAWKSIRDVRLWSWLIGYGDVFVPALVSTGSVSLTLGSPTVQLDPAAASALSPLALSNPPLAGGLGIGRQFRIINSASSGPIYTIVSTDFDANTLTLDRPYAGDTVSGQAYSIYKCYYAPPDSDFLRYITVTNMRAGYVIKGRNLYSDQQRLNAIDAQRGGNGDTYRIANFRVDSTGRPVHEWYPHPVNPSVYNCIYQRRGTDLSATVDLPATINELCLMSLAFKYAADWALANVATYPELAQTNWVMFRNSKAEEFQTEILQAVKQDDEIFPQLPFTQGSSFDFPLGGQFLQNHDVSSLIGGY